MNDDNQILVPPSFIAVHSDARGRLRERAEVVRQRYELCEDLASHLVEHAQTLYHVQTPSETEILRRIHAGLCITESDISVSEATWVTTRFAEWLSWPLPRLQAPDGTKDVSSHP